MSDLLMLRMFDDAIEFHMLDIHLHSVIFKCDNELSEAVAFKVDDVGFFNMLYHHCVESTEEIISDIFF
jgi:hypothetical protein